MCCDYELRWLAGLKFRVDCQSGCSRYKQPRPEHSLGLRTTELNKRFTAAKVNMADSPVVEDDVS